MKLWYRSTIYGLAILALLELAGCGIPTGQAQPAPTDIGQGALAGAGATFPAPFYKKGFGAYTGAHPKVTVTYDAVGSGTGIQRFTQQSVDFGASDVPMSGAEVQAAGGPEAVLQIPTTIGVVGIAYNLPGLDNLKLDGTALAGIFLGKVKRWDDPEIKRNNPEANLPARGIVVVHRIESSGTTAAFTDYLGKQSDEWKSTVGTGKTVKWPVGVGGQGNPGVAEQVRTNAGGVGYVELADIAKAKLQVALLRNRTGSWVTPNPAGGMAAAAALIGASPSNYSITDGDGTDVYPIASLSWAMFRASQQDAAKSRALVYLWRWMITDGQRNAVDLLYAPLPADLQNYGLVQLTKVRAPDGPVMPDLAIP